MREKVKASVDFPYKCLAPLYSYLKFGIVESVIVQ